MLNVAAAVAVAVTVAHVAAIKRQAASAVRKGGYEKYKKAEGYSSVFY